MAVTNYLDNSELAERIQLANGQLAKASFVHKFGAVPAMSQNQTGTIWDVNDTTYPWDAFATASPLTVQCGDPLDAGKRITIEGLDEGYNPITDEVAASTSGTLSNLVFKRVYRAYVTQGATNVGEIIVDAVLSTTTVLQINPNLGQTLMAVYTVPARHTGYLTQGVCTVQANADATVNMFVRYFGQDSFRVGHSFEVSGTGGPYLYPFTVPIRIPEKSDIDVRATMRSNNARITAAFDIVLVRK